MTDHLMEELTHKRREARIAEEKAVNEGARQERAHAWAAAASLKRQLAEAEQARDHHAERCGELLKERDELKGKNWDLRGECETHKVRIAELEQELDLTNQVVVDLTREKYEALAERDELKAELEKPCPRCEWLS